MKDDEFRHKTYPFSNGLEFDHCIIISIAGLHKICSLSAAAKRALTALMFAIYDEQSNDSTVTLDGVFFKKFKNKCKADFSDQVFRRGLKELVEFNFIAKTERNLVYFYNHNLIKRRD